MKTIPMLLSWMPEVQRMLHAKSVIDDSGTLFSGLRTPPVIPGS